MARIPSEYTPYNISSIVATEIDGQFRAYGTDTSELGGNIIYFNSVPLERTVAFKAFIDSIKINLKKEAEKIKKDDQNFTIIKEKTAYLSYDLTINIPAHSVNESRNNLAKIEELQRLILTPVSKTSTTDLDMGGGRIAKIKTTKGVSTRYGEGKSAILEPIFTVLFKNLINSGKPGVQTPSNFEDLVTKGFPCYIESVKYDPDHEAGFFEFDNYLFPKNLKLSVTLNYDSQVLADYSKNKTLRPYTYKGFLSKQDSGMFPFHSTTDMLSMNEIFSDGEKIDTYIFIANTVKMSQGSLTRTVFFDEAISLRLNNEKAQFSSAAVEASETISYEGENVSLEDDPTTLVNTNTVRERKGKKNEPTEPQNRFVIFKPFIESFSRTQSTTVKTEDAADYGIYKRVLRNGVSIGSLEYEITFNVVAKDIEEAKKNAAKIQSLCRLSLRKEFDGKETFPNTIFPEILQEDNIKKNLMFYIPSMIERPGAAIPKTTDPVEMFNRSVDLYLSDFSFEIDSDFGFFEEGEKIFAKAYKITLKMEDTDNKLLREYKMRNLSEEDYVVTAKEGTSYLVEGQNSHLFPFNRKTVKIGGN